MEHRSLFALAVGAGVPTAGMVPAFAGGGVAATTIMSFIVNIFSIGLRFTQLCIDFKPNGRATEAVFQNFLLIYKLINCFKLFFSAYRQVHAEGVGLLAFSCLFGLSIHSSTIVIYLNDNHRSHARAWISSMAILVAAGASLLPMNIPADCTWHRTAVEAILICFACIEAFLLVRDKTKETGGNDNLLQNLIMITAETLINYCMLADYVVKTHSNPWDAEKILHLIGSCLSVLIGLGQVGWIVYKAYTHGVFAWGEERAAGGGDVEAPAVERVAEVVEAGCSNTLGPIFLFPRTSPVIVNEVGTAEEVPPEDLFGYS